MNRALGVALLAVSLTGCRAYFNEDVSDPAIKARVLHQLKADPELDLSRVDVDVHAGVVTLSGIARSDEQRDAMRRIARRQHGVDQVDVNIAIVP